MFQFICNSRKYNFSKEFENFFHFSTDASHKIYAMTEHINFDYKRAERAGIPEVIYSEGKAPSIVLSLLKDFAVKPGLPILFTRLSESIFFKLDTEIQNKYIFDSLAKTAYSCPLKAKINGKAAIVSAGTSDGFVTWEAKRTLDYLNVENKVYEDCGVSGLWRLQEKIPEINTYDMIIVVAGMEAALTSVLAGLTTKPIIGVPTSVGYGVCRGGQTALNSMLACCAPGISVVNIDNGFGAACMVYKTLMSCKGFIE